MYPDIRHHGWLFANAFITGRIVGGDTTPSNKSDERFIEAYADYYESVRNLGNAPMPIGKAYKFYSAMTENVTDDAIVSFNPCMTDREGK